MIRESTYSSRPLGSVEFTRMLETQTDHPLMPQKPGTNKRSDLVEQQATLSFDRCPAGAVFNVCYETRRTSAKHHMARS